jgi:hypothetical protein
MWLWLLVESTMTELMVQKGIDEIVKYGSEAEILDFLIMILRIKTSKICFRQ